MTQFGHHGWFVGKIEGLLNFPRGMIIVRHERKYEGISVWPQCVEKLGYKVADLWEGSHAGSRTALFENDISLMICPTQDRIDVNFSWTQNIRLCTPYFLRIGIIIGISSSILGDAAVGVARRRNGIIAALESSFLWSVFPHCWRRPWQIIHTL